MHANDSPAQSCYNSTKRLHVAQLNAV